MLTASNCVQYYAVVNIGKAKGDASDEDNDDKVAETPSGIENWHLGVPSWADVST
jgi:hypothetical protein